MDLLLLPAPHPPSLHSSHSEVDQINLRSQRLEKAPCHLILIYTRKHSSWPWFDRGWNSKVILSNFIQILEVLRVPVYELFIFLTQDGVGCNALARLLGRKLRSTDCHHELLYLNADDQQPEEVEERMGKWRVRANARMILSVGSEGSGSLQNFLQTEIL